MDQGPLYNQINWTSPDARAQILSNGTPLMVMSAPYIKCPSDDGPDSMTTAGIPGDPVPGGDFGPIANAIPGSSSWQEAQGSYDGSIGSCPLDSGNSACNLYSANSLYVQANPSFNILAPPDNNSSDVQITFGDELDPNLLPGVGSRIGTMVGIRDVTDGTSNTIAIGEYLVACNFETGWLKSNGGGNFHHSTVVPINQYDSCPWCSNPQVPACAKQQSQWGITWGYRSRHTGGANFTFCDGSVHFINQNINMQTYQYLANKADGQPVGNY